MALSEQLNLLLQVFGAMVLGGIIGLEREISDRPAGLRTHMIVAGAAAIFVKLGDPLLDFYARLDLTEVIQADPYRVIEATITGIAFLGAGTIIQRQGRLKVQGLTTAASLLLTGSIGIASAVGLWVLATGLSVATVLLLQGLDRVDFWLKRKVRKAVSEDED